MENDEKDVKEAQVDDTNNALSIKESNLTTPLNEGRRATKVSPFRGPFFDTTDRVKRAGSNLEGGPSTVLMRPTLNSRGTFLKRSCVGSPKVLETTCMGRKDSQRKEFKHMKHLLLKNAALDKQLNSSSKHPLVTDESIN